MAKELPRSSRRRYAGFVDDYRHDRLDESNEEVGARKDLKDGKPEGGTTRPKDYRQCLLSVRVMLSLRRSLFSRLLHLPLPKLWDMKTGGILSRLTGDIDTTTGLLQMALVSPSVSVIRLVIAIAVLL